MDGECISPQEDEWPLLRTIAWICWRDPLRLQEFSTVAGRDWLAVDAVQLRSAVAADSYAICDISLAITYCLSCLQAGEISATGIPSGQTHRAVMIQNDWLAGAKLPALSAIADAQGDVTFSEIRLSGKAVMMRWPKGELGVPIELPLHDEPEAIWKGHVWDLRAALQWVMSIGASDTAVDAELLLIQRFQSGALRAFGSPLCAEHEIDEAIPSQAWAKLHLALEVDLKGLSFRADWNGGEIAWRGLWVEGPHVMAAFQRPEIASSPTKTAVASQRSRQRKTAPQQSIAKSALHKLFGDNVPSQQQLTNGELIARVSATVADFPNKPSVPKPDSILRAAGRRR